MASSGDNGDSAHRDDEGYADGERIDAVPLFPLPGVVLFPGAILPLHVFERRYRQMTRHSVEGEYDGRKLIGICRIREGVDPMEDGPALFQHGCVGTVVDHQRLPDGRYNVLVRGVCRIKIEGELDVGEDIYGGEPIMYRRADLQVIGSRRAFEIDLGDVRERMQRLCRRPPILGTPVAGQLEKLFASPLPTARLADVLAFDLLDDIDEKQALLEETDERKRTETLANLLDQQFPEPDSIRKLGDRFKVDE